MCAYGGADMIRASALFATTMMTAVLVAAPAAQAAQASPLAAQAGQAGPLAAQAGRTSKGTDLELAYLADAGYAVAVRLSCDPPGGAHPKPAKACATLARVGGDPGRIKVNATMCCTMQYDPITAEITGTWRGRQIDWKQRYGNKCEMIRATGALFTF